MMKFGLLTSICEGMTFEEVVNFAAENQLECLEVACWPQGGAQRRYAGVSHIDVANLDEKKAAEIKQLCQEKGVEISSLAYYPNTLEPDEKKRNSYISHLYKLMDASVLLGVNMITTFIGRDSKKNVDENMELVKEVWTPIVRYAEEKGVRIAIANCYECYGLIYNKTILEGYCGMDGAVVSSVDEINNFDTLKKVADDINSRIDDINKELGTDLTEAFASAGLDDGSSWRFAGHLANMPLYYEFKDDGCDLTAGEESIKGTYLDNFKNVWDMYVSDSAADPKTLNSGALNAESEFGMGEAVFYQNGDWEFSPLTNEENGYVVTADDLSMMPIYFGVDDENEGLCVGTENYWAVNAKASQEDIDATLEFLNWVITSDEGRDAITNQMGLTAPYDTFTGDYETKNAFAQAANKLMTDGKTSVAWSFNATPNVDDWRADVVSALTAYTAGEGEWDAVKTAFVDGWANQWKIAHEDDAQ